MDGKRERKKEKREMRWRGKSTLKYPAEDLPLVTLSASTSPQFPSRSALQHSKIEKMKESEYLSKSVSR